MICFPPIKVICTPSILLAPPLLTDLRILELALTGYWSCKPLYALPGLGLCQSLTSFFFLLHLICEMVMTLSTTLCRNTLSMLHTSVGERLELDMLGTCSSDRLAAGLGLGLSAPANCHVVIIWNRLAQSRYFITQMAWRLSHHCVRVATSIRYIVVLMSL